LELSLYRRLHNNLLPLSEQVKVTTAASNREKKTTRLLHVATREQRHRQSTPVAAPILDEVCETVGVTLKSFMAEVAMLNPELTEMVALFGAIDTSCKAIATLVRKSQLPSSEPHQAAVHDPREDQKKLDVIANEALKRALRFSGRLGVLASQEEDAKVRCLLLFVGVVEERSHRLPFFSWHMVRSVE
jgi:Fructose-1-6-bisphosphatase, N-terminal domain